MVKIYFVRHCEAEGNKHKNFQGAIDFDITELGKKQLEFLHKRFQDIHIDKVFSSPLIRAKKTAMAAVFGKGLDIEIEPLFTELSVGDMEGMPFRDIFKNYPDFEDIWTNHPEDFYPPNGEPMRSLFERMKKGLEKIAFDPDNEGKTILVASHGGAIRNLTCHILYNDIKYLSKTDWSVNTAVSLITYNNNKFTLEFSNDDSHLPEEFKSQNSRLLVKKEEV